MPFVSTRRDGTCSLSVYVQPRASKNGFTALHGQEIKLAVTAPPVDNKANKAVIGYLATFFRIPKRSIELVNGQNSRHKRLIVSGLDEEQIRSSIHLVISYNSKPS